MRLNPGLCRRGHSLSSLRRVLVANRGEISIRVSRAAAGVGIESVAVYTPADETGLHTRVADARARVADYLDAEALVTAAKKNRCDCLHPGYGFLSENAELAARCAEEGIVFVGPSAGTLALFGDKVRAREKAVALGVPVIPGSSASVASGAAVRDMIAAGTDGLVYPIMLKASAGGGGRGIRVATCSEEVDEMFDACAREAHHAFGDGSVFVERFLERPRHIEVQVVADANGNTVHCVERDCSVQLRNQKVVEIAPAPNLDPDVRSAMHAAAINLCKSVGYVNVGTVEFLLEGDSFYFLEMNPRIQVEHTVTEEILGIDLVETQFRIADGMSLEEIGLSGENSLIDTRGGSNTKFAVQARVVAVPGNAGHQFTAYREPSGPGVRVDSCAYVGLAPPMQFDPLFAKLVCSHGQSLGGALSRTRRALREFHIEGIGSNVENLARILDHPAFVDASTGEYVATTAILRDHPELVELTTQQEHPASVLQLLTSAASESVGTSTLSGEIGSARPTMALERPPSEHSSFSPVASPVHGALVELRADVGDFVKAGDTIAVLTSMKMETMVEVPKSAEGVVVSTVAAEPGMTVQIGDELLLVRPETVTGQSSVEALVRKSGWEARIRGVHERRRQAKLQGGEKNVAKHHAKGKQTIRERIAALLDDSSRFDEIGRIAGSSSESEENDINFSPGNFVLGTGQVGGRIVVAAGEDFTMSGGSPNLAGLRKSVYTETLALELQCPLVRLHEGSGGSVGGGRKKGGGNAGAPVYERARFETIADCLATVPVCTVASGSVAGLPASRFVASHFSVMVRSAALLTAGPQIVSRALGYDATKFELGGEQVHRNSGIPDNFAESEKDALAQVRRFLSFLPASVHEPPPRLRTDQPEDSTPDVAERLRHAVPMGRKESYDIRAIIRMLVDEDPAAEAGEEKTGFFEMGTTDFGATQVTGLARINGHTVAVMANDNKRLGGAMTSDGADKVVKFLEFAQTFGLPVLALTDEPGFMIGIEAEKAGTIRRGTRAVLTAHKYPHPWCTLLVRRAYGVAAAAHFGPGGYVLSWPSAETGTLPVESGVAVAFGKVIAEAKDPDAKRAELEAAFSGGLDPFPNAENFCVHDLIDPGETRVELCTWLRRMNSERMQRARWTRGAGGGGSGLFAFRG